MPPHARGGGWSSATTSSKGRCIVRNSTANPLSKIVAIEFEQMYGGSARSSNLDWDGRRFWSGHEWSIATTLRDRADL
jgi:hypothetical protein